MNTPVIRHKIKSKSFIMKAEIEPLFVENGRAAGDRLKDRMGDSIISTLPPLEAATMLFLAEKALSGMDDFPERETILNLVKDCATSFNCKILARHLRQNWRTSLRASSTDKRVIAVRRIAQLRGKLAQRLAEFPDWPKFQNLTKTNLAFHQSLAAPTIEDAIIKVYEFTVNRRPAKEEIEVWIHNLEKHIQFHEFLILMSNSEEAGKSGIGPELLPQKSDGNFILMAYEIVHRRGCSGAELEHWTSLLRANKMRRSDILTSMFTGAVLHKENAEANAVHDGLSCGIMGTGNTLTAEDWKKRAMALENGGAAQAAPLHKSTFNIKSTPHVLVTAVASLYKGGDFIEQFMDNITSQSCFRDYCELIIIDADSPDGEGRTIEKYLRDYRNISYMRLNYRVGIYDAWNEGVKASRGEYITNTNLDDIRRSDSLERQAGALDNLPFVDVVYQDFYYTFDPRLSFDEIAEFGYKSDLPIVTPHTMMLFNSPHNAPMWRKRLHDEIGYFDVNYKSAGDYEFWMRCVVAGKRFYKLNDPHVIYYQNPKGLSTRPDTRGVMEAKVILEKYGERLLSENLLIPFHQFCAEKLVRVPEWVDGEKNDRYAQAQRAIRDAARTAKFSVKALP